MDENKIYDLSEKQLAKVAIAVLGRLGQLGYDGRVAITEEIKANRYADVDEGLAQFEDICADTA